MNSLINPRWCFRGLNRTGSGISGYVIILRTKDKRLKTKVKVKGHSENKSILIDSEVTNYEEKINFSFQKREII
jgi:hypothetical protein